MGDARTYAAERKLSTFLTASLECVPDNLRDTVALSACLTRIADALVLARSSVLDVVLLQKSGVDKVLLHAEELHAELSALRTRASALSHESIQKKVQSGILQLPSLHAQLESSKFALQLLDALAAIHRRLELFDESLASEDLDGASHHVLHLRADEVAIANQMEVMPIQVLS